MSLGLLEFVHLSSVGMHSPNSLLLLLPLYQDKLPTTWLCLLVLGEVRRGSSDGWGQIRLFHHLFAATFKEGFPDGWGLAWLLPSCLFASVTSLLLMSNYLPNKWRFGMEVKVVFLYKQNWILLI